MPPTPKIPPKESDWHGHVMPRDQTEPCELVKCPECHKWGCLGWWIDHDNPGNKVKRVAHSHFLHPSYEQRRNYNHIIHSTSVKYKPHEIETVIRLRK